MAGWCSSATARFGGEAVATVAVLAAAIISNAVNPPAPLTFLERDPTLSFQLTDPETVGLGALIAYTALVPIACFVVMHVVAAVRANAGLPAGLKTFFVSLGWVLLAFGQCIVLCFAVTGGVKIAVGRQRPNFFAMCNYAGYLDGLKAGNLTAYFAATTPGVFGDISRCQASSDLIWEAQKSFFSGHASMSFAGMMFATLYLRAAFGVPDNHHYSVAAVVAACPLLISTWIAISRVRDRFHNPDDVSVGALVGIMSALVTWWHYRALRRGGLAPTGGAGALADETPGSPAARSLLEGGGDSMIASPVATATSVKCTPTTPQAALPV